jgi:hypothetical protein
MRQRRLSARLDNDQGDQQGLRGAVGTPDQLREYFRRFEDAGVDQMIFVMQAGKNRHDHIMESIELFGREVLPEFAERDVAIRAKKMKELEPIIEMVMKRKRDDAPKMPADYLIEALPKRLIQQVGGKEMLDKLESDSAIGIPRPQNLQERLQQGIVPQRGPNGEGAK